MIVIEIYKEGETDIRVTMKRGRGRERERERVTYRESDRRQNNIPGECKREGEELRSMRQEMKVYCGETLTWVVGYTQGQTGRYSRPR